MDKHHFKNDEECLRRQKSHDVENANSRKRSSLKRLCCAADKGSWSCRKLEDYASFWRKEGSGEKEELSMKQFVFLQPKMMNIVIERSKKTIKRIVEMVAAVKASQQTVHNTLASDNLTVPC